ncbi:MAG: tryptophan synthase subunit alpha [Bacillaceae bacterium]
MNRLEQHLTMLKKKKEKAFVAYLMVGEHGVEETKNQIRYLDQCGVDVIELGIPFSDPVADGPVIAEAGQRALNREITIRAIFEMVKEVRQFTDTPIVLMTYVNPVFQYGVDDFFAAASQVGVDGVILPDVPFEERKPFLDVCEQEDICYISFISLTSSLKRMDAILKEARGFIYGITVTGITGKHQAYEQEIFHLLKEAKEKTNIPLFAGFGISSPEHVQQFINVCDGVIVGSKIIELFNQGCYEQIKNLIYACKQIEKETNR